MLAAFFDASCANESRELFGKMEIGKLRKEQEKEWETGQNRSLCWPAQGKMRVEKRKYFFFDIDDTLLIHGDSTDGDYVPDSTKEALRLLEENGHFLAIATGRSYCMAKKYMTDLGFKNMVHDGGNGVTIDGEMLGIEPLDYEKSLAFLDECEGKGFPWAFTPEDSMYRLTRDGAFQGKSRDRYMRTVVVPGLDPHDRAKYPKFHKLFVSCTAEEESQLKTLKDLPSIRYIPTYLFIEPMNKAKGIYRVLDHFGASPEDVVVFGDNYNDLSMFMPEWISIAMGNAVPELKEKAQYVTTQIDEDGIFNACRHFGWI